MLVARRYVDEFTPGDAVPEGRYSPESLAGMVAAGLIASMGETTQEAPAAPPVEQTVKTKGRKQRGNQ